MKLPLLFAALALASGALAQNIGINSTGNTGHASAGLDVDFSNKGLLVPRVALTTATSATPISSPAVSLLVYNTATAGTGANAVAPGYYFWSGSRWSRLFDGRGSGWSTLGDAGTDPTSNFLGTTDEEDLVLRTNNTERMRLWSDGRVSVGAPNDISLSTFYSVANGNDYALEGYTLGSGVAVYGQAQAANGLAILGFSVSDEGGIGLQGQSNGEDGAGVFGYGDGDFSFGVYGSSEGDDGTGVYGQASTGGLATGVLGIATGNGNFAAGVYGSANSGGSNRYGGFFANDLGSSGTKPFMIDLPSDPENYSLKHFSMESPEVLNTYRGNVVLNGNGSAVVELPEYFYEVNNENISYHLTPIGAPSQVYILKEVSNGQFEIAGGNPGQKVSWMIMAERNDPYLQQYPEERTVVVPKGENAGKYITPELYGQPQEKGMFYKPRPTRPESKPVEIGKRSVRD